MLTKNQTYSFLSRLLVPPGHMRVWFCKWKDCTYQFETAEQLQDHITNMHTSQISMLPTYLPI